MNYEQCLNRAIETTSFADDQSKAIACSWYNQGFKDGQENSTDETILRIIRLSNVWMSLIPSTEKDNVNSIELQQDRCRFIREHWNDAV